MRCSIASTIFDAAWVAVDCKNHPKNQEKRERRHGARESASSAQRPNIQHKDGRYKISNIGTRTRQKAKKIGEKLQEQVTSAAKIKDAHDLARPKKIHQKQGTTSQSNHVSPSGIRGTQIDRGKRSWEQERRHTYYDNNTELRFRWSFSDLCYWTQLHHRVKTGVARGTDHHQWEEGGIFCKTLEHGGWSLLDIDWLIVAH